MFCARQVLSDIENNLILNEAGTFGLAATHPTYHQIVIALLDISLLTVCLSVGLIQWFYCLYQCTDDDSRNNIISDSGSEKVMENPYRNWKREYLSLIHI